MSERTWGFKSPLPHQQRSTRPQAAALVAASGDGGQPTYGTTVFALGRVGAVHLEVEAATFATRGEIGVRHIFTWDPAAG